MLVCSKSFLGCIKKRIVCQQIFRLPCSIVLSSNRCHKFKFYISSPTSGWLPSVTNFAGMSRSLLMMCQNHSRFASFDLPARLIWWSFSESASELEFNLFLIDYSTLLIIDGWHGCCRRWSFICEQMFRKYFLAQTFIRLYEHIRVSEGVKWKRERSAFASYIIHENHIRLTALNYSIMKA